MVGGLLETYKIPLPSGRPPMEPYLEVASSKRGAPQPEEDLRRLVADVFGDAALHCPCRCSPPSLVEILENSCSNWSVIDAISIHSGGLVVERPPELRKVEGCIPTAAGNPLVISKWAHAYPGLALGFFRE